MRIDDTRAAYKVVLDMLKQERGMRDRVLPEPRRTKALKEIDDAIVALAILGSVVKLAADAGLLEDREPALKQAALLGAPQKYL
jgi:hypothetical protein